MPHNHDWSWKPSRQAGQTSRKKSLRERRKERKREKYRSRYGATRDHFYLSDAWLNLRYRVLKHYGGCCQCCGARASQGRTLNVDHIKSRRKHPELELKFSNLQVLCSGCNLGKGAHDETDWRDLTEEQRAHLRDFDA